MGSIILADPFEVELSQSNLIRKPIIVDHALIIISAITKVRGHSVNQSFNNLCCRWAYKVRNSEHFVIFGDSNIMIRMWEIVVGMKNKFYPWLHFSS